MASSKFNALDFDTIKANIKQFLSNKAEFNDHNFEGSTWSLILDALAYGAHYTGVYSNMALSESFLDTAQLRNSVVSRAKELGYIPRQRTAAVAKVQLDLVASSGQTIIVPAGIRFSASIDTQGFTFQTQTATTMIEDGTTGNYSVVLDIVQGDAASVTYTTVDSSTDQYVAYDKNIDTNSVSVTVNAEDYIAETEFVTIDNTSKVFFLEETLNEQLRVEFGDGVFGVQPAANDIIVISYLSTRGPEANNISIFSLTTPIAGIGADNFVVTTVNNAAGGAEKDSIDRIKFIAPKVHTAQNRLVTAEDYKALLMNNFAGIKSVSVWGGEDNVPAQFGKIFVSIALSGTGGNVIDPLTEQLKSDITNFMNKYKVMSLIPEIVDPDFIYLDVDADVTYDVTLTNKSEVQISSLCTTSIQNYIGTSLQTFGGALRLSKLLKAIDESDPAVVDSLINLKLVKKHVVPASDIPSSLTLNYGDNAIVPGSLKSTTFNNDDYYFDDGLGNIDLQNGSILTKGVGSIDYTSSIININNVNFAPSDTIDFSITPVSLNVASKRLNILDEGVINVNIKSLGN